MLQYASIIEKLSIDEKLAILTNGSFLSALQKEGKQVPPLTIGKLHDFNLSNDGLQYPSFDALACVWDTAIAKSVGKDVAVRAKKAGVNAAMLPQANLRSSVYANGAAEDPYLTGEMMLGYAQGVETAGVTPIISTCALTKADADYADVKPNAKALMDYYLKPFRIVAKGKQTLPMATVYKPLKGEYADINVNLVRSLLEKHIAGRQSFLLCESESAENAVARLNAGYTLCLKGHAEILKEAVDYYKSLCQSVEAGIGSADELEDALQRGYALREESINEGVDAILAFAYRCQQTAQSKIALSEDLTEDDLVEIYEKSVVLLKNQKGALPLSADRKLAIIGAFGESLANRLAERDSQYYGCFAKGYDLESWNNEEFMPEAVALAKEAETVLFFVGFDETREKNLVKTKVLQLPATQAMLLEKIAELGKRLVIIVTGSGKMDMRFDTVADAVLYAPCMGKYGGQVLDELLFGEKNPSGKLPFTMYDNPDERAREERFYKNKGFNKVGMFVGYRRYDTEREQVKYPFGHGLSYTQFAYSNLEISNNAVNITVKNVGKYTGEEVVQFYYGKEDAKEPRPRKELFAFKRISLQPNQSITIRKEIKTTDFASYNESKNAMETQGGSYRIYVASSVLDERASTLYYMSGPAPQTSKEHLSSYLQGKSNIAAGEYFMDTNLQRAQYKSKAIWFGIISIVLAVLYDVFAIVFASKIPFFRSMPGQITNLVLFIIANALAITGIIAMCISHKRKKQFKQETETGVLSREETTEETEVDPVAYERLFLEEFASMEEEAEEDDEEDDGEEKEASFVIKEEVDEYHKEGWSLTNMQEELIAFAAERGVLLDVTNARTLLSAMSVSRLVLIKTDKDAQTLAFIRMINEFFVSKNYVDSTAGYRTSDDVFFRKRNNEYQPTGLTRALEDAAADSFAMKLAHLTDVRLGTLGGYFTQLMRYAVKPETPYTVFLKNKGMTEKSYTTTPNLWIFLYLAEEELAERVPAYIAETASFVKLQFASTERAEKQRKSFAVSKAQFLSFGDKARNNFELDESKWKKIDRLEEYVCARAEYGISNKLWQKMERYASVYLALGGEAEDALDSVVAVKILTTVLALIKYNQKDGDEKFEYVLGNLFGEDNIKACLAVIDVSSVNVAEAWQEIPVQDEKPKTELAEEPAEKAPAQPAVQPVAQPTAQPVVQPAVQPVVQSTAQPVVQPAVQPVVQPTVQPVAQPIAQPVETPKTVEPPKAVETPKTVAPPKAVETPAEETAESTEDLFDFLDGMNFDEENNE